MSGVNTGIDNPKVINGWALFDWANSAYSLVITTAIFPIYYLAIAPDQINLWGMEMTDSSFYSISISFAYFLIAIMAPLLGGIADAGQRRLFFLRFFTTLGSISCIALFILSDASMLWLATVAFIISTIGYAGSLIFYDAFLPVISSTSNYDSVSAKGYALGYVGSVILLIIILWMSQAPATFGMSAESTLPYRIGFVMVGLWWLGFSQISFKRLPKDKKSNFGKQPISEGYKQLKAVNQELIGKVDLRRFLVSFFFYSAGIQTIVYLASVFADKELNFSSSELIITIILLQVVAVIGAYLFAYFAKIKGSKKAISVMILIWIAICVAAYFVHSKIMFYGIAFLVGLVLGGLQSTSRACYSKLIEGENEHNSYFSYYDLLYYLSIVFGTFSFGIVEHWTGNLRYSVLILALFFVIALVVFSRVTIVKTR